MIKNSLRFAIAISLILLFLGCNNNNSQLPKVADVSPTTPKNLISPTPSYPKERSLRGETIFRRVIAKYKFVPSKPIVSSGWCKDVIIPMPINEWKKLSAQDKVNVSLFAENVVLDVRANPTKYIEMPESAPMYNKCLNDAINMCSTCWSIEVGSVATIDGETNLGPDSERIVDGKTVNEFRKSQENN